MLDRNLSCIVKDLLHVKSERLQSTGLCEGALVAYHQSKQIETAIKSNKVLKI